jgi:predicted alpha/beta-hydrolase family hydrolase
VKAVPDTGSPKSVELVIETGAYGRVSSLFMTPEEPHAQLVLAHGAGAGMRHAFMIATAERLLERRLASLRYQFPYMERGEKRTDPPAVATATVRAAVAEAARRLPSAPLFAGGKSFGARMTSTAAAQGPLPGVRGLVFLGFPLHPPGRPSVDRAAHLENVRVPMLFLQGTRDTLCDVELLGQVLRKLGRRATLHLWDGADHSFHVLKRSGRTDAQVLDEIADAIEAWCGALIEAEA